MTESWKPEHHKHVTSFGIKESADSFISMLCAFVAIRSQWIGKTDSLLLVLTLPKKKVLWSRMQSEVVGANHSFSLILG